MSIEDSVEIEVGKGKIIIVDVADLPLISKYKWSAKKCHHAKTHYAVASKWNPKIKKLKGVSMHRLILDITDPKIHVDHINRNGLDNRKSNLRLATSFENQANSTARRTNKLGYKGVCWCKKEQRYLATISYNGKKYRLGSYKNILFAAAAYNGAARVLQGRFAYLNPLGGESE